MAGSLFFRQSRKPHLGAFALVRPRNLVGVAWPHQKNKQH